MPNLDQIRPPKNDYPEQCASIELLASTDHKAIPNQLNIYLILSRKEPFIKIYHRKYRNKHY